MKYLIPITLINSITTDGSGRQYISVQLSFFRPKFYLVVNYMEFFCQRTVTN